ncbi:MAG TPA: hypothetical protein VM925_19490 [Labilithrix sp.]|nr:hypothetical protein [Labilithrix sp.]
MGIRACAIGAAIVLWQLPAAAGDAATAREQLKLGYTLAQEGKCEEAIPHLRESLRLDAKAITIINLADCEEKVGKLADAMGHWVDARARAQAEGHRPIEEEAAARLGALEPRLARLMIVLAPSAPKDIVVERDGVVLGGPSIGIPLPVDPGAHSIVVKASGHRDVTSELTLAEGEVKRLEVDAGALVEAPPPAPVAPVPERRSTSPLVFIGFGVAAAGVVVGSVTGLMTLRAGAEAESACPNRACSPGALDDVEAGRSLGTVSTVSFVVAGAGAALGIYGLLSGGTRTDQKAAVSLSPTGITVRGRF